jgi:hypothetical protein
VSAVLGKASADRNLTATKEALELDAKNIHAWTHRGWVVKKFGLQDAERRFTEAMITRDVRNNSAWNQRFVVTFSENDEVTNEALKRTVDSELAFVSRKIEIAPDNESAWNYLRGVARLFAQTKEIETNDVALVTKRVEEIARAHCSVTLSEMNALFREKEGEDVVPMDANDDKNGPPSRNTRGAFSSSAKETPPAKLSSDTNDSRHAVSLLADVLFSSGDCVSAAALYERLAHRDPIRANYWTHMRDETRRSRG